MKPKPFLLSNHFTLPLAILVSPELGTRAVSTRVQHVPSCACPALETHLFIRPNAGATIKVRYARVKRLFNVCFGCRIGSGADDPGDREVTNHSTRNACSNNPGKWLNRAVWPTTKVAGAVRIASR